MYCTLLIPYKRTQYMYKHLSTKLCCLIFIISLNNLFASDIRSFYEFDNIFDSVAYNSSLIQDRDGFVWLGTTNGLIKFNGYDKITYKESSDNSPAGNQISSVFEDSTGLIWFSVIGFGVNSYNKQNGQFRHFLHNPQIADSLSSNKNLWSNKLFTEDNDGIVWYGSANGLNYFNPKMNTFKKYTIKDIDFDYSIWCVYADRKGLIWIGTDHNGLLLLDPKTNELKHFVNDVNDPYTIGRGRVYSVLLDRNDKVWVGTSEGGLNLLNQSDDTFTRFTHNSSEPDSLANNNIYSIYEDEMGLLWTCGYYTHPSGIEVFDTSKQKVVKHITSDDTVNNSFSSNIIMGFCSDNLGGVWVIENLGDVRHFNPNKLPIINYIKGHSDQNLNCNFIVSIYEDKSGYIWFSSAGGVIRLERKSGEMNIYNKSSPLDCGLDSSFISTVLQDTTDRLWLTSGEGILNLFDPVNGKVIKQYQNEQIKQVARCFSESNTAPGVFWYGTEGDGLVKFDSHSGLFTNYKYHPNYKDSFTIDQIHYLLIDQHIIWLCSTGAGLGKYNELDDSIDFYRHDPQNNQSISSDSIGGILRASDDRYWVSTDNAGLNEFFPETGTFTQFGLADGFTTMTLNSIVEDDHGFLWISSDLGLFKFDPQIGKVIRLFTSGDGLVSDTFSIMPSSAFKSKDGFLWFAGNVGVSCFNPADFDDVSVSPLVHLTSIKAGHHQLGDNIAIENIDTIELNWRENFFDFEFASLNYISQTNREYKYFLEGWDDEWFLAKKKRFGRYTHLPGGEYTLRIMGSNSDGSWNIYGVKKLRVLVQYPFWKTWWFYTCCIILSLLVIILFVIYILKLNNQVSERKLAEDALRTSELNLQFTLNSIGDAVISTDKYGTIIQMNPVAEEFTGCTIIKAKSCKIDFLFNSCRGVGDGESDEYPIFERVIAHENSTSRSLDMCLVAKKGIPSQINAHGSVIKNTEGDVTGIVVVFRDMTEINALNEKIKDTQRMDAIGQLAGGIAHDFNNMLCGIIGYSELLESKLSINTKLKQYSHQILTTAESAAELTGKLLSFSRRGKAIDVPLNLHHEITETVLLLQRSINKTIEVKYELNASNDNLIGDPTELKNVILNISVNARDAMPNGGTLTFKTDIVFVGYEMRTTLDLPIGPNNYIRLCINDTGEGMAQDIQQKIFEPYFTTKEVGEGTGLGLSAVYGTVKDHNGAVIVESTLGLGTTFIVYLPVNYNDEYEYE